MSFFIRCFITSFGISYLSLMAGFKSSTVLVISIIVGLLMGFNEAFKNPPQK